jgi:hypothetical protein
VSEVREAFDLSASDNLTIPEVPILFAVLNEKDEQQKECYC